MVHAASAGSRISDTDRNARPKHGRNDFILSGYVIFAGQNPGVNELVFRIPGTLDAIEAARKTRPSILIISDRADQYVFRSMILFAPPIFSGTAFAAIWFVIPDISVRPFSSLTWVRRLISADRDHSRPKNCRELLRLQFHFVGSPHCPQFSAMFSEANHRTLS